MSYHAIGLVESTSIAQGIEAADIMAKTANVQILVSKSICPGKYIVMIGGDVAAESFQVSGTESHMSVCVALQRSIITSSGTPLSL